MTGDTIHCTPVTGDGTHGRAQPRYFVPDPEVPEYLVIPLNFLGGTGEVMARSGISDILECC